MALFNVYTVVKPPEETERSSKKKVGVMNIALIISCMIMVVFTAVMIWLFIQYNSVPDTLITCVFAVLGGECGVLGWIKTTKERRQERKWQLEDEERNKKHGND